MTRDEVENLIVELAACTFNMDADVTMRKAARALRELLDTQRDNEAELARLRLVEFGISAGQTLRRLRQAPIDMVLFCPACGKQHIDAPDPAPQFAPPDDVWTNPPHRSHLCAGCGYTWRPADVATNGVQAIQTKGKNDSPISAHAAPTQRPAVSSDTVPWPQVTRYSGGASQEGIGGRVWVRLDDAGPEVECTPAAADAWRRTVDDMLTVCGGVASDDPRESVDRLINWHVQVALDPAVSSDAAALVEVGKKAQQACDEAARQAMQARIEALMAELRPYRLMTGDEFATLVACKVLGG